jgi:hypothetical protein
MNPNHASEDIPSDEPRKEAANISIAQLVADIYEAAPPAHKRSLLEHLLRPLGVLGLVALADGIFAKIRFRAGWPELHVRVEDVQNVQAGDVVKLVDYVQQVSSQSVDGLVQILAATPMMTSSAAAVLLVTILMQRARSRRVDDTGIDTFQAVTPFTGKISRT